MRVLVTGGSGVLGTGTVTELLRRNHSVVLLSRHATRDARQWPSGVTPRNADVTKPETIRGTADGCDVALHVVGIVEEELPRVTFDAINVQGTEHVLAEADCAGVPRFVYVSSLGAPTGESAYHKSKRRAEELVRQYRGAWTILRPGNVYGPGDEQISVLLRIVRGVTSLIPTVGDGDQRFQPIWWEDAARALAIACERVDLAGRELNFSGPEVTSQNDLIARFHAITGKTTHRVPIPEFLATLGAKAVSLVGWQVPLSSSQVQMLHEENLIPPETPNDLTETLGVTPTPLDAGLRALADQQPEQFPDEGIGALRRKRYWADVEGSAYSPEQLFASFRSAFNEVTPVFVDAQKPENASDPVDEGDSLTLSLPMRGHVQVRVAGLSARQMTLLTLQGHPLAGAVRFLSEARGGAIRFQVEVYDRAANVIDFVAMRTLGSVLQTHTWTHVVQRMVERSGGTAPDGVHHESAALDDDEADAILGWLDRITVERKRGENTGRMSGAA